MTAVWQVQAAALQACLQLLAAVHADRLPVQAFLDGALRALGSWVDSGCPCGHAQFPRWSQHLVALLHVLSSAAAAGTPGLAMAPSKICQVRLHACTHLTVPFVMKHSADGLNDHSGFTFNA
jgi:hypothetical protein